MSKTLSARDKNPVYEQIKRQNGEAFAKFLYSIGVLGVNNIANIVKYAGRDPYPISAYLMSLKNVRIEEHGAYEHPLKLLDEAGYNAFYADTLEKQNDETFRSYFGPGIESLCTFNDPNRFKLYHIIHAVKKDVDKIKREDFVGKENRQDLYGTSVISIQMLKTGGYISITNRYNDLVPEANSTFDRDPDQILKGLAASLRHYYVDFSSQPSSIPENYVTFGPQIIHYRCELNDVYFGPDYYAKDGEVYPLDKNVEIMLDSCILNVKDKTLRDPSVSDKVYSIGDDIPEDASSIVKVLANELNGKAIQIKRNSDDPEQRDENQLHGN